MTRHRQRVAVLAVGITAGHRGVRTIATGFLANVPAVCDGCEVTVYCSADLAADLRDRWPQLDCRIRRMPRWTDSAAGRVLAEQVLGVVTRSSDLVINVFNSGLLFRRRPQLVLFHAHMSVPSIASETAAVVGPSGGSGGKAQRYYERAILPRLLRASDRIVFATRYIAERARDDFDLGPQQVGVVHYGVDPKKSAESPPTPRGDPYILSVGTLFRYKNYDSLIRGFARLRADGERPVRLVIIGLDPGGEADRLRSLATDCGVGDTVTIACGVGDRDLVEYFERASVFAFLSLSEGFGFPPLEAMAYGLPVVASDRMGIPEVVGDAALVVDPLDVDAVAAGLARALHDEDLRLSLQSRGFDRVERHRWTTVAKEYAAEIRRLIDHADPAASALRASTTAGRPGER